MSVFEIWRQKGYFGGLFFVGQKNHLPLQLIEIRAVGRLITLPRECIKEIYIGANASLRTRMKILETIDRRKLQVQLFEAYVAEDRYALNFREVAGQVYSYRREEVFLR